MSTDVGSNDETTTDDDDWDRVEKDMVAKHVEWEEADRHEQAWNITLMPKRSERLPLDDNKEIDYDECKKDIQETFKARRCEKVQAKEVDEVKIKGSTHRRQGSIFTQAINERICSTGHNGTRGRDNTTKVRSSTSTIEHKDETTTRNIWTNTREIQHSNKRSAHTRRRNRFRLYRQYCSTTTE